VNKGVLVVLMAGMGIGVALSKMFSPKEPQTALPAPRSVVPEVGHKLAERLRGFLEVERN
jgi:hypothetical protein